MALPFLNRAYHQTHLSVTCSHHFIYKGSADGVVKWLNQDYAGEQGFYLFVNVILFYFSYFVIPKKILEKYSDKTMTKWHPSCYYSTDF